MSPVRIRIAGALAFAFISAAASAADYPAPKEGDWMARDFRFHTGEVMPELRLHYTTLGNSSGEVGRACVDPPWHRRLRSKFLDARLRGRVVRLRPAARRKQILHRPARRARTG